MKQASQFSTFGKILEDGRIVNVVVLRNDGRDAVVRPLGPNRNRVIALPANQVFERFE